MIQCQACGTENPPDAAYCAKCARKLDAATQQAVVERRAAHTATGIRWSTVLITALIIIILAVLVTLFITHVI
jgi:uncharacterized membrane protein YvbJ